MTESKASPRRVRSLKWLETLRQRLNGWPPIVAISLAIAVAVPAVGHTASGGPQIVGWMQNVELYKRTRPRPDFQWQDEQGQPVSLTDFAGKVVLFNFWATWCAPCIRELPSLDRLNTKLGGDKFIVVTLNIDRAGKPVALKMVKRLKLKTLALPGSYAENFARPWRQGHAEHVSFRRQRSRVGQAGRSRGMGCARGDRFYEVLHRPSELRGTAPLRRPYLS